MPMRRRTLAALCLSPGLSAFECPDLWTVPADLEVPPMIDGRPSAGRRVRQVLTAFETTRVHHALYLPRNWRPGGRYPVLVEYAGNGNYVNAYGDRSAGTVDGVSLGYGISGGRDYIWVSLPFVDRANGVNAITWWGDVEATIDYCLAAVQMVCEKWGGDRDRLFLTGFSRGAIAGNYIGLHTDTIAGLWRGFVAHSHYDGVRTWPYPGSDRASALARLARLQGRPQFISHECSVEPTREYLEATGIHAPWEFLALPYRNHTDQWVLRDLPERRRLREWLKKLGR